MSRPGRPDPAALPFGDDGERTADAAPERPSHLVAPTIDERNAPWLDGATLDDPGLGGSETADLASVPIAGFLLEDTARDDASPPKPSHIFGRYELLSSLGSGGMAEVFLARQLGPYDYRRRCVIKRMHPMLRSDAKFVDLFLREAQTTGRLHHQNTISVIDFCEVDGELLLVLEHLNGISLQQAARRSWAAMEPLPMAVVLQIIRDAALGLHHAHTLHDERGTPTPLVHRDVSPDNIMLTTAGVTKVLDFGVAKDTTGPSVTATGEIKGKIAFMAPEQLSGLAVDGRADLWALGVTLYWLLTGTRPFTGKSWALRINAIMTEDPAPPSSKNPYIPAELDAVVLKALAKKPEDRFPSTAHFRDALRACVDSPATTDALAHFAIHAKGLPPADKEDVVTGGDLVPSRPDASITGSEEVVPPTPPARARTPMVALAVASALLGGLVVGVLPSLLSDDPSAIDARAVGPPADLVEKDDPAPGETPSGEDRLAARGPPEDDATANAAEPAGAPGETGELPPGAANLADPSGGGDAAEQQDSSAPDPTETLAPAKGAATERGADRVEDAEVASDDDVLKAAPAAAAPSSTRRAARKAEAPKTMRVQLLGPSSLRWRSRGQRTLRTGPGSVRLPASDGYVLAIDPETGGQLQVPIRAGKANAARVAKGTLRIRAKPWAYAFLGKRKLGATPFEDLTLPAGRYEVVLKRGKKTRRRSIVVSGGKRAMVRERF